MPASVSPGKIIVAPRRPAVSTSGCAVTGEQSIWDHPRRSPARGPAPARTLPGRSIPVPRVPPRFDGSPSPQLFDRAGHGSSVDRHDHLLRVPRTVSNSEATRLFQEPGIRSQGWLSWTTASPGVATARDACPPSGTGPRSPPMSGSSRRPRRRSGARRPRVPRSRSCPPHRR